MYNDQNKSKKTFSAGDYLVCTPTGLLNILAKDEALKHISVVNDKNTAVLGDNYLANTKNFSIEFFGDRKRQLKSDIVVRWPVCSLVK